MEEKQAAGQQAEQKIGNIKIADEVVCVIAGLAAADVKGVIGMSSGIADDIAEIIGRKNMTKGVKVEVKDNTANIDLFIVVEYGSRIPEVAWEIQEKVKNAVETMTGLDVPKVNINVQGVHIKKEKKKQTLPQEKTEPQENKK